MQLHTFGSALFAALGLCSSAQAWANAGVSASGDIASIPGCAGGSKLQQGNAQASATLTLCSASTTASIDLAQGVLRTTAESVSLDGPKALSVVTIEDKLSFSGGGGSPALLDWSIDGFISNLGGSFSSDTFAQLTVIVFPTQGNSASYQFRYGTADYCNNVGQPCVAGSSFAASGAIAIPTDAGPVTVLITLGSGANAGWSTNFGHTAHLYLALPPAVAVSSDTGAFLVAASPVPEAPSAAIWLLGLAGLAWRRRRA